MTTNKARSLGQYKMMFGISKCQPVNSRMNLSSEKSVLQTYSSLHTKHDLQLSLNMLYVDHLCNTSLRRRVERTCLTRATGGVSKVQVEVLPRLHHKNLVGCAGVCAEKGEGMFVFEYMPSESLQKWLFEDARKRKMTWLVRRNICLGASQGILHWHSLSEPRIVHRDINPKNILLDENLQPKVAGYQWLAVTQSLDYDNDEVRTGYLGTPGYVAPEYFHGGELSRKSDVYSFGVVLLRIVSGRRTNDFELADEQIYLPDWLLTKERCCISRHGKLHSEGRINELVDPTFDLHREEIEAIRIIKVAFLCLHDSPETRPDVSLVVAMLQGNLNAEISRLGLEHENERLGLRKSMESSRFPFAAWTSADFEAQLAPVLAEDP